MIKFILFFTRFLFFKVFFEKLIKEYKKKQIDCQGRSPKELAEEHLGLISSGKEKPKTYYQPIRNL